ncbi:DMT family transporter [Thalassospira sp.]|uniref:DMT family transporter n=1 Tax=Thalassospira sp. TaxID=1912094 RepID=UPI0032EB8E87|tara:strand:- start:562 stop:1614 length:1053 start_codon:yes stop_codon:yes gene_type:complete
MQPSPPTEHNALRGTLLMIGSAFCMAAMAVLIRYITHDVHPFEVAFFRNLFGLIPMLPWILTHGRTGLKTDRFKLHFMRAALGLGAMLCLFTALSISPAAQVIAINFTLPILTTVLAALIVRETVRARRWSAIAIGFVGAMIIIRPFGQSLETGMVLALVATLFMAAAMTTVKMLSRTESANAIVTWMGLIMAPLSLIPALMYWQMPTLWQFAVLLLLGAFATAGQQLLVRAYRAADQSYVMIFDFLRLPFVAAMAFVMFGEVVDIWTWAGAALIIGSALYIARREAVLAKQARIEPRLPTSAPADAQAIPVTKIDRPVLTKTPDTPDTADRTDTTDTTATHAPERKPDA